MERTPIVSEWMRRRNKERTEGLKEEGTVAKKPPPLVH